MISGDLTSVSQTDAESNADPRICLVGCLADDPVALEAAKVCFVCYFTIIFFYDFFQLLFRIRGLLFFIYIYSDYYSLLGILPQKRVCRLCVLYYNE